MHVQLPSMVHYAYKHESNHIKIIFFFFIFFFILRILSQLLMEINHRTLAAIFALILFHVFLCSLFYVRFHSQDIYLRRTKNGDNIGRKLLFFTASVHTRRNSSAKTQKNPKKALEQSSRKAPLIAPILPKTRKQFMGRQFSFPKMQETEDTR